MFAIRDDREYVNQEDLTKAARKVGEAKKHESEFNFCQASLLSSDPEAHHSKDGVLDVIFSVIYISLLFLYVRTLNFAMSFRTIAPCLTTIKFMLPCHIVTQAQVYIKFIISARDKEQRNRTRIFHYHDSMWRKDKRQFWLHKQTFLPTV